MAGLCLERALAQASRKAVYVARDERVPDQVLWSWRHPGRICRRLELETPSHDSADRFDAAMYESCEAVLATQIGAKPEERSPGGTVQRSSHRLELPWAPSGDIEVATPTLTVAVLVRGLGRGSGMSRSTVSRSCWDIDEDVMGLRGAVWTACRSSACGRTRPPGRSDSTGGSCPKPS